MSRSSGFLKPRTQLLLVGALALLVFTTFPFAWMASTALKPSREIFLTPPTLWPTHVTFDNLGRLFVETRFLTYFRNSLAVSSATVGLTLLVSLHRWAESNAIHLKLVNPRPFVYEMLTRTHLDCVFDISTFDHALAVLGCECRQAHAAC